MAMPVALPPFGSDGSCIVAPFLRTYAYVKSFAALLLHPVTLRRLSIAYASVPTLRASVPESLTAPSSERNGRYAIDRQLQPTTCPRLLTRVAIG